MLIIKNATFKAQFNYIKKALKIKHWQQQVDKQKSSRLISRKLIH